MPLCSVCSKAETTKLTSGEVFEPKADSVKGKDITARVCGSCTQFLIGNKYADIPWGGIQNINREQENEKPILKRRKHISL